MCGPRNDWSTSTPIPHTPFSFATRSVPNPQAPATLKTDPAPLAIWPSATALHLAGSNQSLEYPRSVLIPGSAFLAPAS